MRVRARAIDAAYSISAFLTAARQLDWSSSFPSVLHSTIKYELNENRTPSFRTPIEI